MSVISTQNTRRTPDRFEPEDMDPHQQRRLRGLLEQIDYTAHVANRELIAHTLGELTTTDFDKMAARTAQARARWLAEALRFSHSGSPSTADQVARISAARLAFEELSAAHDGLRLALERGYVNIKSV